jgi:hypothetical protein
MSFEVRGGAIQSPIHAEILEDFKTCDWIEFEADGQTVRLHERESTELAGYYIYVESVWKDGCPGEAECLAVTSSKDPTVRNAAIRAAVLLGIEEGTKAVFLKWWLECVARTGSSRGQKSLQRLRFTESDSDQS